MIGVLFCGRLAFDQRVQRFLKARSWAKALPQLAILKNFFLAYMVSYVYTVIAATSMLIIQRHWPDFYTQIELPLVEFMGATLIVQIELCTRVETSWGYQAEIHQISLTQTTDTPKQLLRGQGRLDMGLMDLIHFLTGDTSAITFHLTATNASWRVMGRAQVWGQKFVTGEGGPTSLCARLNYL
jgi:hypothetical protein